MADQGYDGAYDDDFADDDHGGSLDGGDAGFDFDAGAEAEGWSPAELNAHLAEVAREAIAPYLQQIGSDLHEHAVAESERERVERVSAEADELEEKYEELQDDELQDVLLAHAAAVAEGLGAPHLANEPAFLEQVYLASRSEFAGAIDDAVSRLEGDRIVEVANQGKFQPFLEDSREQAQQTADATAEAIVAAFNRGGRFRGA